jgi:hypothetical protein
LALGAIQPIQAQVSPSIDFSQATRSLVELSDSSTIDFLMFELFLAPLQPPDRLQVIDVTRNGFGPDDILIAYPSAEVFLIPEFVPDSVQAMMGMWRPEVDYRMDSGNMPSSALAALIADESDTSRQAENAILYDLVQAVERSYRDLPVAILFERDSLGFSFQLWDYNRDAMRYAPRPAFVSDSAASSVLSMLEDVGYMPGANRVRLGVSLESQGESVATVDRALLGISTMADLQTRSLAVRTILLGSYDRDRSGTIDTASEIDAPPCEVWTVLEAAFPNFLSDLGFTDSQSPYLGNLTLNIAPNVKEPASRRIDACLAGETPPPTDPDEVVPTPETRLPELVGRYSELSAAADIVRGAGIHAPGSVEWTSAVETVLVGRFDEDASGLVDAPYEVESVPCEVWEAVDATHPTFLDDFGFRGGVTYLGQGIGVAPAQRRAVTARATQCVRGDDPTTLVRLRRASVQSPLLPPTAIREAVTIPLRGLGDVPNEESRYLPAKTVLLAMFDLDRSGFLDHAPELDAIPCEVWAALDVTFPGFGERFGFVRPSLETPYRGNIVFNVSDRLRAPAERRILACREGITPPVTAESVLDAGGTAGVLLPVELADFLELQAAATVAQSTASSQPGSAAWAATVRSVLVGYYDFNGSGALDRADEIEAVPCLVWATTEATYGGNLTDVGLGIEGDFLADRIGISAAQRGRAASRVEMCRE